MNALPPTRLALRGIRLGGLLLLAALGEVMAASLPFTLTNNMTGTTCLTRRPLK